MRRPPASGGQRGVRDPVDGAKVRAARRTRERRVVEDDRDAVRRETYVELHAVRAFVDRTRERLERVLRGPPLAATATMTENDDGAQAVCLTRHELTMGAQTASSSAISFISFRAPCAWSAGSEIAPTTGCPPPPCRSQMAAML